MDCQIHLYADDIVFNLSNASKSVIKEMREFSSKVVLIQKNTCVQYNLIAEGKKNPTFFKRNRQVHFTMILVCDQYRKLERPV